MLAVRACSACAVARMPHACFVRLSLYVQLYSCMPLVLYRIMCVPLGSGAGGFLRYSTSEYGTPARRTADTFVEAVVAVLYFVSHAARLANASASARASATISDGVATAGPEPQPYVLAAWLGHAGRVGCTRRPSGNTMRGGAAGWLLRHLNAIHVIIEEHRLRQNVALPVRSEEPCEVFIYSLPSTALIYFRDARAHAGMRRCHRGEC